MAIKDQCTWLYLYRAFVWLIIPFTSPRMWFDHPLFQHSNGSLLMMTSSNGSIFRVIGPLCEEFTGHRWIPHTKNQWRRALMFSLICAWINDWVNNREADNLIRHGAIYDVIVRSLVWYWLKCTGHRDFWEINLKPGYLTFSWNKASLV